MKERYVGPAPFSCTQDTHMVLDTRQSFAKCCRDTRQRKGTITALAALTVALPSANLLDTRQRFFLKKFSKNSLTTVSLSGAQQKKLIFWSACDHM